MSLAGFHPTRDATGFKFDAELAEKPIRFIQKYCFHVEGDVAGQPFILSDWQRELVRNLFGWVDDKGLRRFREVFLYVPRKNSKTTLSASIALFVFFGEKELGQQIYAAAGNKDQAMLLWGVARKIIENSRTLSKIARVMTGTKDQRIEKFADGSVFRPIASLARTKHGYNTHLALCDELHSWNSPELYDVLQTSMGARAQPIIISTTTADIVRPSLCNEKLEYARKVRDGIITDPRFMPVIYETPMDADWESEEVWKAANPNWGLSVRESFFRSQVLRAKNEPRFENEFKRLHLNMQTQQSTRWLPIEAWDAGACEMDEATLVDTDCFGGLDLASTRDLSAFVLWWPSLGYLREWFWVPADGAREREKRDKVPYETWGRIEKARLTLTPGNVIDYSYIREEIAGDIAKRYPVRMIGVDPYNARHLAQQLQEDGLEMLEHRQGFLSVNEPSKALERFVHGRTIKHAGNPVMRWCIGNSVVETDPAGNIKPSKKLATEKIDGLVALVIAMGTSLLHAALEAKNRPTASVYETRGALVI